MLLKIQYQSHFSRAIWVLTLLLIIGSKPIISNESEETIPDIDPPVFSHAGGLYSEPFNLVLDTPLDGVYPYTVSKDGYESVTGEVQLTGQDLDITITLHPDSRGQAGTKEAADLFDVTFQVDMSDSPYEPGDTVFISGDMIEDAWPEPGSDLSMIMEPTDEDPLVCSISFALPGGNYQYKYFLHAGWSDGEWSGDPNRQVTVYEDVVFQDVWGEIGDPDDPEDPDFPDTPATHTVTFHIEDQDGNDIEDATITFDGETADPGTYVFTNLLPEAEIRYTTDGSPPLAESELYTTPITITDREGDPNTISMIPTNNIGPGNPYDEHWQEPAGEIFKINVIRARAFLPDGYTSPVETHSFLVDNEGTARYSLPLISVNAHEDAFFDADSGIYVHGNHQNYHQRGREWERHIHFELFENEGSRVIAQDMGVRIHGGTSRNRPRKSLRLYARSDYGTTWVDYPLFPDKQIEEYKRFLLRNSGNDWGDAIFRDAFMQSLLKDMELDLQYSRPAVVFINGEYWGIHNIRDRLDNRYLQTHYGLDDEETYTVLEGNAELDRGNPEGIQHYEDMIAFLENEGVSDPENFEELKTRMDVKNFTNYQISQIYVMNTDWPGNNIQYWRYLTDEYEPGAPEGLDGRWRWQVFDLDFGFGLDFDYVIGVNEGAAHNTLSFALEPNGPDWPNPPWSTLILRKLLENETYRQHFITRFSDLLNTTFDEQRVQDILEAHRQEYLPEMPEHIHRWRMPDGMEHWESELAVMEQFATERPAYMRQYMAEEFNLGDLASLSVDIEHPAQGNVRVNTIEVEGSKETWTGEYFKGLPVELEAVPSTGYRFSHWEGLPENNTAEEVTFDLSEDKAVTAHFQDALIHYWHFNNLPDGDIIAAEANYSTSETAVITYPGTGEGYMDRTDGTLLNTHQSASAGYGLRVRNPSDTRELLFEVSSEGYEDLAFSFAVRHTPNGQRQQSFYYSPDAGENWIQLGEEYDINPDFQTHTFDMTGIQEVNDNPDLRFRILFEGEETTGDQGNNRFDNIALNGSAISLTLNQYNPATGYENETYPGHYFSVSGGTPPYTYEVSDGSLPAGLNLSSDGFLSGFPTEDGHFTFTVNVTDDAGAHDTHTYTLEIQQLTLIHYWHFNNLLGGTLLFADSDMSLTADNGQITYPGTGDGYMDRTDGTLLNIMADASAGYGLRVRNPSDSRELIIKAPSTGYEQLAFSYAVRRTTNGVWQQEVYYSPDDGTTWTFIGDILDIGLEYAVHSFDLSDFPETANNPALQFKILFKGEESAGDDGNNRFDNLALQGIRQHVSTSEPDTESFELKQNYPNPFSQATTIPFRIKEAGHVRLDIFDLHGTHIETILDGYKSPGLHEVRFNGGRYPKGVYIYRLNTQNKSESQQMLLF
ncbi:MAG: CotH kinase family protein [Bacteroidales bacterium]